jgi:hypothetical protein
MRKDVYRNQKYMFWQLLKKFILDKKLHMNLSNRRRDKIPQERREERQRKSGRGKGKWASRKREAREARATNWKKK